jgi:hypothetical protein
VLDALDAPTAGATAPGAAIRSAVTRLAAGKPSGLPAVVSWRPISQRLEDDLASAVKDVLRAVVGDVAPRTGRFDDVGRTYRLRAFVRVRRDDGCPTNLVWSGASEPFRIVPWYESGDLPPVQVSLPDVTKLGALKRLKPNVAFVSPENVFNRMRGMSLEDVMDKKSPPSDTNFGIDWICAFSIPIITLCALIVLSIFLSLLNFIFWWLPFVKICIPVPKKDS